MMRYLLLVILFPVISCSGQSPDAGNTKQVRKYLNEVCAIIKEHSLYADSIHWQELHQKIGLLSKGLTKIDECKSVIDTIIMALRKAGDNHSGFLDRKAMPELTNNSNVPAPVDGRYTGDGVGYIKVPPFYSMNLAAGERFASEIQNHIKEIDEHYTITGWVVDLRGNTGGNMHPMIRGLVPLIGEGIYGYVLYPKKRVAMSTESGQTAYIQVVSAYKVKRDGLKIAVLIDSSTASSGEFTAIAFKSLPNVRFFGQASAGYTTSNQTFRLSDGACLYLATAYMADRKGNQYWPNIIPDTIIPHKVANNLDLTIDTAKAWLLSR